MGFFNRFTRSKPKARPGSVAAATRNNKGNSNKRISSAANSILNNLGRMGNRQETFGNKRNNNNAGTKTSKRVANLKNAFAAADKAKEEFIEESEKKLKSSASLMSVFKTDKEARQELFKSFNRLKRGDLGCPENADVKRFYKFIIPLYLYFIKFLPDLSQIGLGKASAADVKSLKKQLETLLENIESGKTNAQSGGADDDDTVAYDNLWGSMARDLSHIGMASMFIQGFGMQPSGSPIDFFIIGIFAIIIGIGAAIFLVELITTIANVLFRYITSEKRPQAREIVYQNPLISPSAAAAPQFSRALGPPPPYGASTVGHNGVRRYNASKLQGAMETNAQRRARYY